jgi:tetratricopeptide (TPR) repeat protein
LQRDFGPVVTPRPASVSDDPGRAIETRVRDLLTQGKSKTALESAKDFHKLQHTAASESLLLDAYGARIESLIEGKLVLEAKSLLSLVRERFPAAKERWEILECSASTSSGDLAGLLGPLNDPDLDPERRASIEKTVQTQITDLRAIADCAALPPEHRLREAAGALDRAFNAVTSGPVTDEQIALTEVSHRSPLAPWKLVIHAIARLYRGEDNACRPLLIALKPGSVPSRLAPAMLAILGDKPASPLKPAEAALVSRSSLTLAELRGALANLDRAFAEEEDEARVLKLVRTAVRECQRSAPDLLVKLKQLIVIRAGVGFEDNGRWAASMEGAPRRDAAFLRMQARVLELSGDPDDLVEACEIWDDFRQHAVRERWFPANGIEAATLYLHMAEILSQVPGKFRHERQRSVSGKQSSPEEFFRKACAIDPHSDAFSKWLRWGARESVNVGETVAREWNRALPHDLDPLLYLMIEAEKRNAFPTALSYLERAERIDAIHSAVRMGRLRLLARAAMRHLQQKKPHLAAEKVAALAALPQSQQGHRPAFLAALRQLVCISSGDRAGAEKSRMEVEKLLASRAAAELLDFGIAEISKQLDAVSLCPLAALTLEERAGIPASLARVLALVKEIGIRKFSFPVAYLDEMEAQFPKVSDSLDVEQLGLLGEMCVTSGNRSMAWTVSAAGLQRGESTAARFLYLRVRAMPPGDRSRHDAIAAAAVELARLHRDMEIVDRAVEALRDPFGENPVSLTLEQAREVMRREIAWTDFPIWPDAGPDYSSLIPDEPCQCPECRKRRANAGPLDEYDALDEDDLTDPNFEKIFYDNAPEGMPPELSKMLFDTLKEAFLAGISPDEVMSQLDRLGNPGPKKRRRKK